MADVTISPNLNMPIPTVGVDPGPDYANNLNACLTTIDNHNHTLGRGLQIPTAGIHIDGDLPLNGFSANSILSLQLNPQGSPLPGISPFLNAVYVSGVDLYYNDGNGNQVRITSGGNVAGAAGTITGLPSGTASASYQAASGTFQFQQATSTAANLDVASIAIRYPGSFPTPAGNYIQLQAPTSLASGFSLTLPLLPGAQSFMSLDAAGHIIGYAPVVQGLVGGNLANKTITATQIADTTITSTQIASNTILGSNIAGGAIDTFQLANDSVTRPKLAPVFQSLSNGVVFSNTGNALVDVPGLNATLVTTGRPVVFYLICDDSGNGASLSGSAGFDGFIQLQRTGTNLGAYKINGLQGYSMVWFDAPLAGSYLWVAQINPMSGTIAINHLRLLAYEL